VAARPLSRDRILKAAFTQADKHGVEAVSMRSLASTLGVEAMSLYHHVPNKQAILDGLVDLIVRAADFPTGEVTSSEWVRGAARGMRALAQKHPRLVPLLATQALPFADPKAAVPFEAGLAAFCRDGYEVGQAYAAVQSVTLSLLAMTQLEATYALQGPGGHDDGSAIEALPESAFPLLRQVVAEPVGLDDFWELLTAALVKGLDRLTP
jgi:AcrR family transcriptional regulator